MPYSVQACFRTVRMAIPAMSMHLARTVAPECSVGPLEEHDNSITRYVFSMLSIPPQGSAQYLASKLQAQLPIRMGGLGICRLSTIARAAYAGSWSLVGKHVYGMVMHSFQLDSTPLQPPPAALLPGLGLMDDWEEEAAFLAQQDAAQLDAAAAAAAAAVPVAPAIPLPTPAAAAATDTQDPTPATPATINPVFTPDALIRTLQDLRSPLSVLPEHAEDVPDPDTLCSSVAAPSFGLQRKLSELVYKRLQLVMRNTLLNNAADEGSILRLNCVAAAHAGAFLQASPALPSLRMSDTDFRIAVHLRMGAPIFYPNTQQPHPPQETGANSLPCPFKSCATKLVRGDLQGTHALTCPSASKWHARHNLVAYTLARSVRTLAGKQHMVMADMEPRLLDDPYFMVNRKHLQEPQPAAQAAAKALKDLRADVRFSFPGAAAAAEPIYLDVQITHPRRKDGLDADKAVKKAENRKRTHYKSYFTEEAAEKVTPYIMDTYGQLGPCASKFLEKMVHRFGGAVTDRTKDFRQLYEQISVALQRGNAALIRTYAVKFVPAANKPHWLAGDASSTAQVLLGQV